MKRNFRQIFFLVIASVMISLSLSAQQIPEREKTPPKPVKQVPQRIAEPQPATDQVPAAITNAQPSGQQGQEAIINPPPATPPSSGEKVAVPLSRFEFVLSVIVLVFGLIMVIFEGWLIRRKKINPGDTIKFITITIIITATLFLITAGYSNDQIAPAVGLLGTIAGYLLGKTQTSAEKHEQTKSEED
ncbi:MAG: hypothetical protein NTU98_02900 [Bacteroidetes bacterium]|nr:hypothetical protein [Bacteroidota bacterium]